MSKIFSEVSCKAVSVGSTERGAPGSVMPQGGAGLSAMQPFSIEIPSLWNSMSGAMLDPDIPSDILREVAGTLPAGRAAEMSILMVPKSAVGKELFSLLRLSRSRRRQSAMSCSDFARLRTLIGWRGQSRRWMRQASTREEFQPASRFNHNCRKSSGVRFMTPRRQ